MIHRVDTNHLTMTALAGISRETRDEIKTMRGPRSHRHSDVCGHREPAALHKESGLDGPYLVTEWGATGLGSQQDRVGAPIENDSTTRRTLLKRFETPSTPTRRNVSARSFFSGTKAGTHSTWYGMVSRIGEETATVDVMHYCGTVGGQPIAAASRRRTARRQDAGQNIRSSPAKVTRQSSLFVMMTKTRSPTRGKSWKKARFERRATRIEAAEFPGLIADRANRDHFYGAHESRCVPPVWLCIRRNGGAAHANIPF